MREFAVIGAPIAHSLSPLLHEAFARAAGVKLNYTRILLDEARFEDQVRDFFEAGGAGLNVTAPGKMRAFELSVHHARRAKKAKAANTLMLNAKGEICADNTDGYGLISDLTLKGIKLVDKRVLIIGAGGAVRAVLPALMDENPRHIHIANRTVEKARALVGPTPTSPGPAPTSPGLSGGPIPNIHALQNAYDLVIHGTSNTRAVISCLMAPPDKPGGVGEEVKPGVGGGLQGSPICYDLNYSPSGQTAFTQWAYKHGFKAYDGFGMLVAQAREAFRLWHR